MSLKVRVLSAMFATLLTSLLLGGGLWWLHAGRSVRTEMDAALAVGIATIRNATDRAPAEGLSETELKQFIAAFDGDRHLRATLLSPSGAVLARSALSQPGDPAPGWFARLIGANRPAETVRLPGASEGRSVLLQTDPQNEMSEVWTAFGDNLKILALFCLLTVPAIYLLLGRALRPLDILSRAFVKIGTNADTARVLEGGPTELVRLARGFNAMAERLEDLARKNERLCEQIVAIQDEERAELARDLHDDVGPYLFAMRVDTAALRKSAERAGQMDMVRQTDAIINGINHVQLQVKAILGRLRVDELAELGLTRALENLVAFWQARHPDTAIELRHSAMEGRSNAALDAAIYRVVQESLANAIRHGRPNAIWIRVDQNDDLVTVEIQDDGKGFERGKEGRGFGIRGMEERVAAVGGALSIGVLPGKIGAVVTARIPLPRRSNVAAA